jgi:hypothetical protein
MHSISRLAAVAVLSLTTIPGMAQDALRGHWSGPVEIPNQPLTMEVDLDKTASGWIGTVSIPAQKAAGLPLEAISFSEGKFNFRIKGIPGEPTFQGAVSADGKMMEGKFSHGPAAFDFKFTRTGDPKIEPEKNSPAVAKEFLGSWEGTLEAGQPLRLILKLANDATGAKGVLVSVDQGGIEIAVSSIEQKDSKLKLIIKMVGGEYDAELDKTGSELSGTWSQAGNSLPLKLKKVAPQAKKP